MRTFSEPVKVVYDPGVMNAAVILLPESLHLSSDQEESIRLDLKKVPHLGVSRDCVVSRDSISVFGDGDPDMGMNPTIQKVLEIIFLNVFEDPRDRERVEMYF